MTPSAEKDTPQFPVPEGWLPFGSLIDYDGPAECSEEVGEDGLPLWERPLPPALPLHRTEAGYPNCSTCDDGGCPDCTDPA